jgi:hypothetical protein
MIVGNKQSGPVLVSPDSYSSMHDRASFGTKHAVKMIDPDPN